MSRPTCDCEDKRREWAYEQERKRKLAAGGYVVRKLYQKALQREREAMFGIAGNEKQMLRYFNFATATRFFADRAIRQGVLSVKEHEQDNTLSMLMLSSRASL